MLNKRTVVLLDNTTRVTLEEAVKVARQTNRAIHPTTLIRMMVKYCLHPSILPQVIEMGDPIPEQEQK